jgi:hypothetical protein
MDRWLLGSALVRVRWETRSEPFTAAAAASGGGEDSPA